LLLDSVWAHLQPCDEHSGISENYIHLLEEIHPESPIRTPVGKDSAVNSPSFVDFVVSGYVDSHFSDTEVIEAKPLSQFDVGNAEGIQSSPHYLQRKYIRQLQKNHQSGRRERLINLLNQS
jgi:hypothetical protein